MSTKKPRGTVMFSAQAYKTFVDFYNTHKTELEAREITDVSKLIRTAAKRGLPLIEQEIKK
jgi:hypothetical protein